jgi:hypothetical protein
MGSWIDVCRTEARGQGTREGDGSNEFIINNLAAYIRNLLKKSGLVRKPNCSNLRA